MLETVSSEPYPTMPTSTLTTHRQFANEACQSQGYTVSESNPTHVPFSDSSEDECQDSEHLEAFHRISDILSNLIQQANEAVGDLPKAPNVEQLNDLSQDSLPVSLRQCSSVSSPTPTHITAYSPYGMPSNGKRCTLIRPAVSSTLVPPSPLSRRPRSALVESYKRLNTSMERLESLSRDLTPATGKTSTISAFVLLPLLHIPHTLITLVIQSVTSLSLHAEPSKIPHNVTGMVAWAFFLALANLMMDRVVSTRSLGSSLNITRPPLPGAYTSNTVTPAQVRPRRRIVHRRLGQKRRSSLLSGGDAKRVPRNSTPLSRSQTQPGYTPTPIHSNQRRNSF